MRPRLRTRILRARFRNGGVPRSSRPAKRLDGPHQLPALGFRELRPNRHLLSNHSVSQKPEKSSRRSGWDFWNLETRGFTGAFDGVAGAFRAVLVENNCD